MTNVFAHRGYHRFAEENTIEAFLEARRVGAQGVELDVRRTADGALVVHHDPSIAGVGAIAEVRLSDLPVTVARFDEAMDALTGLAVNVEIKNSPDESGYDPSGALVGQVVGALHDGRWPGVIISSFDLATCEAVRALDSEMPIGWLIHWTMDTAEALRILEGTDLDAIHPYFARVDESHVRRAHELGLDMNVWTVNAPEDMARMVGLGVDTLITDAPEEALALLDAP
jgi:glycerophosphoryl diester phosphodiesterase